MSAAKYTSLTEDTAVFLKVCYGRAHARERSARGVPTPSRGTVPRRCGVGQARKRACQCACRTLADTLRVLAQIASCRPAAGCMRRSWLTPARVPVCSMLVQALVTS